VVLTLVGPDEGSVVGLAVGLVVVLTLVGPDEGSVVGLAVGLVVVLTLVGPDEGSVVGLAVGPVVVLTVGLVVGDFVGLVVGKPDGLLVGSSVHNDSLPHGMTILHEHDSRIGSSSGKHGWETSFDAQMLSSVITTSITANQRASDDSWKHSTENSLSPSMSMSSPSVFKH